MDSKDADAAIWIAVRPGMGDGGIIDWQKLKNLLTGRCHEINHRLEIAKIAHTGTFLTAQREYRHLCSGKLAVPVSKESLVKLIGNHITHLHFRQDDTSVHACLPEESVFFVIDGNKLQFQMIGLQGTGINIHNPLTERMLHHRNHLLRVPGSQNIVRSYHTQAFAITKLRSTNYETHYLAVILRLHLGYSLMVDAISKGTAIEISILWNHFPMVVEGNVLTSGGCHIQAMLQE